MNMKRKSYIRCTLIFRHFDDCWNEIMNQRTVLCSFANSSRVSKTIHRMLLQSFNFRYQVPINDEDWCWSTQSIIHLRYVYDLISNIIIKFSIRFKRATAWKFKLESIIIFITEDCNTVFAGSKYESQAEGKSERTSIIYCSAYVWFVPSTMIDR